MKIFLSILSAMFFLAFGFSLFATILAIYNGSAESLILFFKMLAKPHLMIQNIGGALAISANAMIQFLIIWIFYFFGRFFWKKSRSNKVNDEILEKIEPKFEI